MNLLLTGCFEYSSSQLDQLRSIGYEILFLQHEDDDFPHSSEVDAVVCNGLFLNHSIDEFTRLKFIQLTSAGFDRVPVDTIKERGIEIYNARGVYSTPMAEWAVFRVLEHYKKGWFFKQEQDAQRWTKNRNLREIQGLHIAIIGAGNVGQEVAKRFSAFGAEMTGFDIHTHPTPGFNHMAIIDTLHNQVGEYDVVIVTAPLLPTTQGIISREVLRAMKHDALLVNIARGGLIDEQAMYEVLTERKDLFAALDVFETEPLLDNNPLWKLKNVALSPHNSFVGNGNNSRMFNVMYHNLKSFYRRMSL